MWFRKSYKKGMADAIEAYEGFGKKQEAALEHVSSEVKRATQKVDDLGGQIGKMADYITDQEKAELYKLNTSIDIAELDDAEKRVLLAILFQLATDEGEITPYQQNYLRAVQQYIKISNPQTEIDLRVIENVEDISSQKAIYQAVVEFFRLGSHPDNLTVEQKDLLDSFQLNRRSQREIDGYVVAIVRAVGLQGLAEKYGFVPEEVDKTEDEESHDISTRVSEKAADLCIRQLADEIVCRFRNGTYFLETQDYIVYFRQPQDDEDGGLFRMNKQTAEKKRINIDYTELASDMGLSLAWSDTGPVWTSVIDMSYHIYKNIICLTITDCYSHKGNSCGLIVIDIESESRTVVSLPIFEGDRHIYTHLSGNEEKLIVHICGTNFEKLYQTRTYLITTTSNNRIYHLEPQMDRVLDVFIWEGQILVWGVKENTTSLFTYDPQNHILTDLLESYANNFVDGGADLRKLYEAFPVHVTEGLFEVPSPWWTFNKSYFPDPYSIDWMEYRESIYYISARNIYGICGSGILRFDPTKSMRFCSEYEDPNSIAKAFPLAVTKGYIFYETYDGLGCYSFDTQQSKTIDRTASYNDFYIMLGDYLYKGHEKSWQKTYISPEASDLQHLQWEVVQF